MKIGRLITHPVLTHKRSRIIFLYFFILAGFLGIFLGYEFHKLIKETELDLTYGAPSRGWLTSMLISINFQVAMVFLTAIFASSLTARFVVGPIKRLEQWLLDWQAGQSLSPFRGRTNDKFSKLIGLINVLFAKLNS